MSEQHPALSPERVAFRERYNVRLVTEKEEGAHIARMPEGIYGFTGSPASEELPIFCQPSYRCFEVHKLVGGEIALVGYVTEKEYTDFQKGTESLPANLYPDPHGESTRLISIPLSRVDRRKAPSREEGNWMRVDLAPKAEYEGLSSSAN